MAGNEKKSQPGDGPAPRENRRIRRQLNWKGALIAAGALVVVLGGGWLLYHFQEGRQAHTTLELASKLESEGSTLEAIQYLRRLLDQSPRNEAEILPELTRLMDLDSVRGAYPNAEIIRLNERLLSLNPTGPRQILALRRLTRAHLDYTESLGGRRYEKVPAEILAREGRLPLAEKLLGQLKAAEKAAREQGKPCPSADESQTYFLEARAYQLRVPDESTRAADFAKVLECLEKSLELSPTNVETATAAVKLDLELKDTAAATRVIDRLAAASPDSPAVPIFRSDVASAQGHEDEAHEWLVKAQELAPENVAIRIGLIHDAIKRQDLPEARRLFAAIPAEQRNIPKVALVEVIISDSEGRFDKVQELLRAQNLASGGTDTDVLINLINAYLRTGQVAKARPLIANLRRQIRDDRLEPLLDFFEAKALQETGRLTESLKILLDLQDGGFTSNPAMKQFHTRFFLTLAGCHEGLGEADKAGEVLRAALVADPNNPDLELAYGKWLQARDPEKSIALMQKRDKAMEDTPRAKLSVVDAMISKQEARPLAERTWGEVDALLDTLLKQDPDGAPALLRKARRQFAAAEPEAALATLESVTGRDPKLQDAWIERANIHLRTGKLAEALALFERAAEPDALGDGVETRLPRARLLAKLNRRREARDLLTRDLKDQPELAQAAAWKELAQLDLEHGDLAEARDALKNWSRLESSDPRPTLESLYVAIRTDDGPAADGLLEQLESILSDRPGSDATSADAANRKDGTARKDPMYRIAKAAVLTGLGPKSGSRLEEFRRPEPQRLQAAKDEIREVLKQYPSMPNALQLDADVAARLLAYDRRNGGVGPEREQAVIDAYRKALDAGSAGALPKLIDFLAASGRIADIDSPKLKLPAALGNYQRDRLAADACARAGAKDEAIRFAERYVAANQSSPESLAWKAQLLAMLGKGELVEADVQRMIEQRPTDLGPWLVLIQLRAQKGRAADVDALIQKAQAKVAGMTPEMIEVACRTVLRDFNRADQAYQRAFDRYPEDNALALQAADYYKDTGRPILAESKYREVLRRDPANRAAIRMLAILATEPGQPVDRWKEAWNSLGTEAEGQPESIAERYTRAVLQLRAPDSKNRQLGIARMKDMLADIPANTDLSVLARIELIQGYLREQDSGPSIEIASEMATQLPSPLTLALHAETLLKGGRRDEATAKLDDLASRAPGDTREAQIRIQLLWDPKQPEPSAEALEACYSARAQSDPRAAEPLGLAIISILEAAGKLDAVEGRIAARLVEQNPGLSWIPARIAARSGDKVRALALCETAVSKGTAVDRGEACNLAIGLAYDNPDPALRKQAEAVIDAALKADRNAFSARFARAMMHHIQGRYDEEIKAYRELVGERMEKPEVLNNLAWALCEFQNKPDEALKFVNLAIERLGALPSLLDTRGVIYTRLKDRERALADLGAAVERQATPARRFHLARALALGGDSAIEQACKERDQALRDGLKADAMEPREKADLDALRKL